MLGNLTENTSDGGKMGCIESTITYTINREIEYEIICTLKDRYDGDITYHVLIDPIDLSSNDFKDDIKEIIRRAVGERGRKISIEIFDKRDSLQNDYDYFLFLHYSN